MDLRCKSLSKSVFVLALGSTLLAACSPGGAKGVVKEYLNQKNCADRAQYILDPEKNSSMMLDYYKARNVTQCVTEHKGVEEAGCDGANVGDYCTVTAKGVSQTYEVKKTANGFKIDFRATYGTGPDTLKRLQAETAAGVVPRAFVVRAKAKIEGPSSTDNDMVLVRLREDGADLTARIYKKLPDGEALLRALVDGQEHRVMVSVGASDTKGEFDVYRLVQEGWRQRDDEDKLGGKGLLPASLFLASASAVPPKDQSANPPPKAGAEPVGLKRGVVRLGKPKVDGRLPPEVVDRVARGKLAAFGRCYDEGLGRDPRMKGRVTAKFVVDRTGAVSTTANDGSELADAAVVACVLRTFGNLAFPQPEGGVATVVVSMDLAPTE